MEDVSEPTRDKQKEGYGRIATFLWIAFGIYLFAATPEAHFVSWQAAVFFVVGMFAAAVVFGGASYAAMGALLRFRAGISPHQNGRKLVYVVLLPVLMVGQYVVMFLVARWVFGWLVGV